MMKTIPTEQLDERLDQALGQQDEHEAIGLTKATATVAWVVRVPDALKDSQPDAVLFSEGPEGRVFLIVQAKHVQPTPSQNAAPRTPVFGAGRGSLTVVSDDDEYLKDFEEYMR